MTEGKGKLMYFTEESDVDILVEPYRKSLLDLSGMKIDLEEALNKKVDINTYNGLNFSTREGLKRMCIKRPGENNMTAFIVQSIT